ncbi:MAG: 3'(2'),5'-bisphosphate nucleotidase CysQ [Pseudomonadota bacterium]
MPVDDPDLALATDAAVEAGGLAARLFRDGVERWTKPGNSVVTEADIAVDKLLNDRLSGARPDYGWLSEETTDDLARLDHETIWVVDPIDGTRAFVDGGDEWTISIGLVRAGVTIAGVIHNPLRGETYRALRGQGAERNGQKMTLTPPDRRSPELRIAGPKYGVKRLSLRADDAVFVPSLAYRLAQVADSVFHASVSSGNAHEWDVAAGCLIVEEAGGRVVTLDGEAVRFNKLEPKVPSLIAGEAGLVDRLLDRVDRETEIGQ